MEVRFELQRPVSTFHLPNRQQRVPIPFGQPATPGRRKRRAGSPPGPPRPFRGPGTYAVNGAATADYPVIQGVALVVVVSVVTVNLGVDLAYAWLDPRVVYS